MDSRTIDAVEGQTILEAAIAAKMPHMSECGGNARCTTCRVQIVDGLSTVGLRTPAEEAVGARKGWGASGGIQAGVVAGGSGGGGRPRRRGIL